MLKIMIRYCSAGKYQDRSHLHTITRPIMMISRCFGICPVSDLTSPNFTNLRYNIKTPYSIICLASVLGQAVLCSLSFIHLFTNGCNPRAIYKFLVNFSGILCTSLIQKLAFDWPEVVRQAALIENNLPKYNRKSVSAACIVTAVLVFLGALVDFGLGVKFYSRLTEACFQGDSLAESYYLYTMPWASAFIAYSPWIFILMQILSVQIAFVTNFTDVLIMILSLYLISYFDELNDLIGLYRYKHPSVWSVLRVHYNNLTRLVRLVDDTISSFILFSFGSNLALICVQLFKLLRKDVAHAVNDCQSEKIKEILDSFDRTAYFTFSFLFLVGRAFVAALIPARLHSVARTPINMLYEVPSSCYNKEAHRLLEQMRASTVALSGLHFFYVTRSMLLSMAATILTYELVIIQFANKY